MLAIVHLNVHCSDIPKEEIESALLSYLATKHVACVHIHAEPASREAVVYLKTASMEDAGRAFSALSGVTLPLK